VTSELNQEGVLNVKKFKYVWLFAFSLIMVFGLVACGGDKETSTPAGGSSGSGTQDSGVELAQGVTEDTILVGHLGPQTGNAAAYDLIRMGANSYLNYVNEQGGVHGRKFEFIAYDDVYQPAKTVQLAKRLVEEDKVFAMVGNVCTPCNVAVQDYYTQQGIPIVMIGTGAKRFVDPPIKNYFGSDILNYNVETKVFIDYAVNKLGAKNLVVVYQNDDYGKEGLNASREAIPTYPDVKLLEEIPYVASESDMSSQAQKIKQLNPDAIIMLATPNPAANMKKELYKIGLDDIPYIVSSVGANDLNLYKLAGEDVWTGTISASPIPMPDNTDDPAMKLYVERFSKDFPGQSYSGIAQWGWGAAQVFVEALERTGPELTREKFLESFYTFDNWQGSMYAGVTFTPDNHYGLTTFFMTEAKDGTILPITKNITFDPKTGEVTYEQ
jgi:branched-chain amino acid transport system substrate-binding protein